MVKLMDRRRLLSPTGNSLHPLEKKIYQELKPLRGQLENKNVVVAVSGGIDSVVLIHVLAALKTRFKYKLHIVHINHNVRGPESEADSRFVGELAKQLKVSLTRKKLPKFSKSPSENTLREGRYKLLFEAAEKLKAAIVVTAHHQEDLLETRLMRLLQSTGIHGLKSMTLLSSEGVLRPFISLTRRDIETYARSKNLAWRNDATNFDTTKFRNWIRRNWLGVLRREHPEYLGTLASSLERIISTHKATDAKEASSLALSRAIVSDDLVYSYLRYHAKSRVTSRHVTEFKKLLRSPKKKFRFRLAGVDWAVDQASVQPL
jgi:tRNA(Ile)-lysidine synthase